MRSPRSVDVEITSRCNLRCTYCYYFDNPDVEYRDLPAAEWLAFFDELGRHGVMEVTLCGGEPFIRKDLPELIDSIVRNGMRFSILSNGSLIGEDLAASIAATGRCDFVQVSIDGSRAEVHDTFRGAGAFDGAVRGIDRLKRRGVHVASRVTIHRRNVADLENTARLLLEELGLDTFTTNASGYVGSCRRSGEEVLLSVPEREQVMKTLLELERKYPGRITATAGPLAEAKTWKEMEEARRSGAPSFSDRGRLTGCGCPENSIAVRADGTYVTCIMLAHMELGRINKDTLEDVWLKSPALARMRKRHTIPLSTFEECRDCGYRAYCTGNCPGLGYNLTGEIDRPSPDACLRRYLDLGGVIPAEQEVPA